MFGVINKLIAKLDGRHRGKQFLLHASFPCTKKRKTTPAGDTESVCDISQARPMPVVKLCSGLTGQIDLSVFWSRFLTQSVFSFHSESSPLVLLHRLRKKREGGKKWESRIAKKRVMGEEGAGDLLQPR